LVIAISQPDRYHENCFSLFSGPETPAEGPSSPVPGEDGQDLEDESGDNRETMANLLVRALEARGAVWQAPANGVPVAGQPAGVMQEELVTAVAKDWHGKGLDGEELGEALRLTCSTNPRIRRDPRREGALLAAPRRPRPVVSENTGGRGEWKRRRGKVEEGEEEQSNNEHDEDDDAPRIVRGARRGARGGATAGAAGGGKGLGKRGGRGGGGGVGGGGGGGGGVEKEEKNPWIQCDGCHRWVQARSDNIEDISVYDDANPYHLDYYCPRCRKKRATDTAAPAMDDVSDSAAPRGGRGKNKRGRNNAVSNNANNNNSNNGGRDESDIALAAEEVLATTDSTRRSTRAKGARKRAVEEEEEEGGRLESVERTLLEDWEEEKTQRAATLEGDAERQATVRTLERKFEEEAAKYKATLLGHRNAAWERNARDADAAADVELLDDKAEEELALQYKDWFEKRRAKLRALVEEKDV
jgi:hypothetical protein